MESFLIPGGRWQGADELLTAEEYRRLIVHDDRGIFAVVAR